MGMPLAEPNPFRGATRVISSLLSPLERRTLRFLAERMPAWVNSDHLTVLGLLAMLGAGLSFWAARDWPGGLVLVVLSNDIRPRLRAPSFAEASVNVRADQSLAIEVRK